MVRVPYQENLQAALDALKEREQKAGRDYPGPQTVVPFDSMKNQQFFETDRPTFEDIERSEDWMEEIGRGEGIAIVLFGDDGIRDEILFAGYSFD